MAAGVGGRLDRPRLSRRSRCSLSGLLGLLLSIYNGELRVDSGAFRGCFLPTASYRCWTSVASRGVVRYKGGGTYQLSFY